MTLRTLLISSAAAALLSACGNEMPSSGASVPTASEASVFTLDYEAFTLDNGLQVILQRDASDPIVAVSTVIHAGSSREKPGRTGFAHFFEHMAFNDSENVPRGWNRGQIPKWGGQRNGGTWNDGTIYYEVVPKDAFDKILWIDSDRLGYMINTVTTDALEREKQVVKNEKRQRVDNAAYGYTNEVIRTALYPSDHPYNWTTIGSLPDLQAATLGDVREFYDDWYGPNNATLSIVGDINIDETKKKVELWFGEIPRGRDIPVPVPQAVTLDASKNLFFEDNFAKLPELRLTFPTVDSADTDKYALSVLGELLGGSKTSPLYVEVVETAKLAPNVSAWNNDGELAGTFTIWARGKPGTDLDDVMVAVDAAFARFEANDIDADTLLRIKAEQETQLYAEFSTALGKANAMAQNNVLHGDPAYAIQSAAGINAVTAEDVRDAYNRYVKDKPRIITSFVPTGQADLAVDGAERATVWIEEVVAGVTSEEVSAGDIADYEKTQTAHDRSEPPFSALPLLEMPDIWTRDLANGVTLRGIETTEIPLVQFEVVLPGGRWMETPEQNGRLDLLSDLMNQGTATKTPGEWEQAVGLLGSGISVSAGAESLTIRATSLARNFEATLALIEEVLTSPRWQDSAFERVKSAQLTSIKGREGDARSIAALAYDRLIYGDTHPLGRPSGGNAQSVATLTMDDLKRAHADVLNASARFHIAGDIDPDTAEAAVSGLAAALSPSASDRPDYTVPAQDYAGRVVFIDVPGAKQSVLRIGALVPDSSHPDFKKIQFTNEKLGGGIAGDLAQILRIEKGYTYGAGSFVPRNSVERPFTISTSVRSNATQGSLETIREMVRNYPETLDAAAVETTQQKIIKASALSFESLGAKLGTLSEISRLGLSDRYVEEEQAQLVEMTADEFQRIARDYLNEDAFVYVVVGDKATQFGPTQAFATESGKGDVIELDIFGSSVE
ncbi:peptidase M16 [Algimonas arctica]|uniref:Peptidase M16 n=1 Tax=Algimonas arctica TaxID=1479486 RepID=A0A8J3G159_9PROT|nr:pitrilysin family protein [Algimonas arctica]GHA83321.1 peptidase M16 [Algimonas arctica]